MGEHKESALYRSEHPTEKPYACRRLSHFLNARTGGVSIEERTTPWHSWTRDAPRAMTAHVRISLVEELKKRELQKGGDYTHSYDAKAAKYAANIFTVVDKPKRMSCRYTHILETLKVQQGSDKGPIYA